MSPLAIAPLERKDLRRIVEIEKLSFPHPWSLGILTSELDAGPSRRYTKAIDGRTIVGYLGLMYVEDEVHVNTLAVIPERQRGHVATELLLDGFDDAVGRGARDITLEVAVENDPAQRLYRKFGLAPVGVRRDYYGQGEDAVVMWGRYIASPEEVARRAELRQSLG
jgi:[ribosomal protein S18]-alanine N-acetyltransferase